tara:strand:+ start:18 stop:2150 length:2133 start_codon:yes stop_codon:yes gene_type:complete
MAIKYLGGNKIIGLSSDTKPSANNNTGTTFLETNTDDLYMWDGDSWNIVAGNSIAQTFSNKSFTSAGIEVVEGSAPGTPSSGIGVIYVKTDNKIYFKNDSGIEYNLTESAAGTLLDGLEDTTITSPTDGAIIAWDEGTSRWRDATVSGTNTLSDTGVLSFTSGAITDLSATATVSNSNDFVMMYDASASGIRKVTIGNLVAGGVSSDTISLLNDTTISNVAGAHVLIYDGTDSWDNKAISGDITLGTDGAVAIASGAVVNADINASADIAISKTALVAGTGITLSTNTLNVDAAQTQITSVGALDAGSITSNFGTINTGASAITTTGLISGGSLDIDDVLINGATIGHTDDTDLMTVADGILTIAGEISVTTLDIGGTNVASTAAELNIMDGGTSATSTTLADADRVVVNDNGTMVQVALTDFETYFETSLDTLANVTTVGALNAGSITSGFGTIDTGSSNITTTGTVSAGNLTVTGTTTTVNSTVLTVVDPIIHLQTASGGGNLSADTNKDVGLMMEYYSGSAKQAFLGFDDSAAKLTFVPDATLSSEVVSGSVGTIVANLEGDVTGDVTGSAGTATGLAGSATILATGRTISASGDITWTSASFNGSANVTSVAAITADVIVNADIKSDAAIADTKLAAISTANKVALSALDIDGGTDIGAAIVDADLFIVDDGAGGTNRKVAASALKTYASGDSADQSFAIAMAVAL